MKSRNTLKKKENDYYKRRTEERNNLLLKTIRTLVQKNNNKPISTIDIYKRIYNKGYAFSVETLYRDLNKLQAENLIEKEVVHFGKGYGTRSMWNLPKDEK